MNSFLIQRMNKYFAPIYIKCLIQSNENLKSAINSYVLSVSLLEILINPLKVRGDISLPYCFSVLLIKNKIRFLLLVKKLFIVYYFKYYQK